MMTVTPLHRRAACIAKCSPWSVQYMPLHHFLAPVYLIGYQGVAQMSMK